MLSRLRFLSAGESHGPRLTAILDGLPAGFAIDREAIDLQLARRQKGYGSGGRMKIERDRVRLSAGCPAGCTIGAPLVLEIENLDWENWKGREIPPLTSPRPGHADLTGAIKYGHRELRMSLERASARETAMRVAAGAICRQILAEFGIEIGGYVRQLGELQLALEDSVEPQIYRDRFALALQNDLTCPDAGRVEELRQAIKVCRAGRDTLGGVFEVVALGLPPGLGSFAQWDQRLEARLALAMMSIQAMKGVEVGPAFANAARRGSEVMDQLFRDEEGRLLRRSNRAGGTEGGISTGEPLLVRVAMKPISTILAPLQSVDLASGQPAEATYERSDVCALPRAVPIGEAMLALVILDQLLEKLGGDSRDELLERFARLRRSHLDDLPQDNAPWGFVYE